MQTFTCPNCGYVEIATSFSDCDMLEDSICPDCDYGLLEWTKPVEE